MFLYRPEKLFVTEESWEDASARAMVDRLPGVPVQTIPAAESVLAGLAQAPDPIAQGKRVLVLARHRGSFLNPCPGAGAEMCCNYHVVNYAANCPMDCSYCVLQSFLDNPALVVFSNIDDLLREVVGRLSASPNRLFRIGAGDFSDPLALDHITCYSRSLVPLFAGRPNGVLELKTKSAAVSNLEGLHHGGRTVVSWSVNSRRVIHAEETGTADLHERIVAARRCQEWGYRIGFHFDPLVCYPGWQADYKSAVEEIFRKVDPAKVQWISLGSLRFTARLRDVMRRRFPRSRISYGEFVPGHHGKWRYFRPIRREMYASMISWIRRCAPEVFIYLCMEHREVWRESMLRVPRDAGELSDLMDSLASGCPPDSPRQ